jgi:hypothetical protein
VSSGPSKQETSQASDAEYSDSRLAEAIHVLSIEANIAKLPTQVLWIWDVVGLFLLAVLYFPVFYWVIHLQLVLSLLCAIAVAVYFLSLSVHVKLHVRRLKERMPLSGILERLAIGPPGLEIIYNYTPWPWSLIYLGARARRFRDWIKLLSRNLVWNINEPRTLFRIAWIGYPLGWLIYITFWWLNLDSPMSPLCGTAIVFVVLIPALALRATSRQQQELSALLLRDYLRERLVD